MKASRILIALFLSISFFSCKNEETKKTEEAKVPELYTFTLNATVKQNDDFQLFFKEDNNTETPFEETNSVWSGIKGAEMAQNIVFALPEGVFPTQLRFDFGQNKNQSEIIVNSFKVTYKDKSFNISGKDFFTYFIADENFVKVDKEASKAMPVAGTTYDPMFYSSGDYNAQMVKISQ